MDDVIFKTSGSSGAAKSIVRTETSLQADADALVRNFPSLWAGAPSVVATVPSDHMFGALWRVRAPRRAGCTVWPATAVSVEELLEAKARQGRILLVTTPSFLERALEHPDVEGLKGALAGVVTSGSALREETARSVAERLGVWPLEIYGSTETGTVACRSQSSGPAYRLVPDVSASVDETGRLVVTSPWSMTSPRTMSDSVELIDSRTFRLMGRTDRQVKILEELVSLPDIEAELESHPLVRRARVEATSEAVPRLGALVVLTQEGLSVLASGTYAALVGTLRRDLLPSLGPKRFPRRIRVVRALPVDARGKTTASAVRAELSAWCREPAVLSWEQTGDALSARLVFPPDCDCFKGHFPGFPVLPGVAQLFFLRHFARQVFPDFPERGAYRRLKFQKLVLPGVEVSLSVLRKGPSQFAFFLSIPGGPSASGLLEGGSEP